MEPEERGALVSETSKAEGDTITLGRLLPGRTCRPAHKSQLQRKLMESSQALAGILDEVVERLLVKAAIERQISTPDTRRHHIQRTNMKHIPT